MGTLALWHCAPLTWGALRLKMTQPSAGIPQILMSKRNERSIQAGQFRYEGLDRTLHERARLGIMTSLLTAQGGRLFGEIKRTCALTDGNLSRHLEVLRRAGLIEVRKGFEGVRPQTLCRLTAAGRRRFRAYLFALGQVIKDAEPHLARRTTRPKV